jgi:hypothetical protein
MMNRVKGPGRWEDVQVGEPVELSRNGLPAYAGLVDDRTADGEVVWVSTPIEGAGSSTSLTGTTSRPQGNNRLGAAPRAARLGPHQQ